MNAPQQPPELRPTVQCIREVRVEVSFDQKANLEWFYCDLLGLQPWTDAPQIPGGIGLGHSRCGLYLQFRHDPKVDPVYRRMMIVVSSLPALIERLSEVKLPFQHFRGFSVTDERLLIHDPAGHLVEVRQLHGDI